MYYAWATPPDASASTGHSAGRLVAVDEAEKRKIRRRVTGVPADVAGVPVG